MPSRLSPAIASMVASTLFFLPSPSLRQAGLHIAAERPHLQVRSRQLDQRPGGAGWAVPTTAPGGRSASRRTPSPSADAAKKASRGVLPRQQAGDRQPVRAARSATSFHRMDREIDPAVDQGLLDLLGEQAPCRRFPTAGVEHLVAGGLDHNDLDRALRRQVGVGPRPSRSRVSWAWASASGLPRVADLQCRRHDRRFSPLAWASSIRLDSRADRRPPPERARIGRDRGSARQARGAGRPPRDWRPARPGSRSRWRRGRSSRCSTPTPVHHRALQRAAEIKPLVAREGVHVGVHLQPGAGAAGRCPGWRRRR